MSGGIGRGNLRKGNGICFAVNGRRDAFGKRIGRYTGRFPITNDQKGFRIMDEFYTEPISASEPMRQCYVESIDRAEERLRADATARRNAWISPEKMAANPEFYRDAYREMLGIPTCQRVFGAGIPAVTEMPVGEDSLCTIARLKVELAPDIFYTGLLLRPKHADGAVPLVIGQHGGGGTPELCSDFVGPNNYRHMVRRLLQRGAMVFAPQNLKWNFNTPTVSGIPQFGTPYHSTQTDHTFRQCGTSLTGFQIYAISRSLDYLFDRENIRDGCGMIGCSYGGFYTLYTMASDPRIRGGYSVAMFNDRFRYNWSDIIWKNAGAMFLDGEVAGLCAPRKLWIECGKTDPVFDYTSIPAVYEQSVPYFEAQGVPQNVHLNLHEGGHTIADREDGFDFLFSALE